MASGGEGEEEGEGGCIATATPQNYHTKTIFSFSSLYYVVVLSWVSTVTIIVLERERHEGKETAYETLK